MEEAKDFTQLAFCKVCL